MKRMIVTALCTALALCFAACGASPSAPQSTGSEPSSQTVQLANPYFTFDTLKQAEDQVGFSIQLPDTLPDWVTETVYRAKNTEMLEIIFHGENDEIRIRKALGSEDISGDQTAYGEVSEQTIGEHTVTLKGDDGSVHVAVWQADDYTYSVTFAVGMDTENACAVVESIQ